jgi:hypothetical protein
MVAASRPKGPVPHSHEYLFYEMTRGSVAATPASDGHASVLYRYTNTENTWGARRNGTPTHRLRARHGRLAMATCAMEERPRHGERPVDERHHVPHESSDRNPYGRRPAGSHHRYVLRLELSGHQCVPYPAGRSQAQHREVPRPGWGHLPLLLCRERTSGRRQTCTPSRPLQGR